MTSTPPSGSGRIKRVAANEETTVLTPVAEGTDALDRILVSHRTRWIIVTSLLVLLLAGAAYFIYYLWNVSDEWAAQVDDVTAQNYDLGSRLATEQEQVVSLQADLDETTQQLRAVQQRVLDLSADIAARDDNAEFYARQINDLSAVLSTASSVTNALNQCIENKTQLAVYLENAEDYDPAELAQFESGVKTQCDAAVAASTQLQRAINQ